TLADANKRRPVAIFAETFSLVASQLDRQTRRDGAAMVKLIDATPIPLGKLCDWAKSNGRIRGLKMHVVFDPKADCPSILDITDANLNDAQIGRTIAIEAGAPMSLTRAIAITAGGPRSLRRARSSSPRPRPTCPSTTSATPPSPPAAAMASRSRSCALPIWSPCASLNAATSASSKNPRPSTQAALNAKTPKVSSISAMPDFPRTALRGAGEGLRRIQYKAPLPHRVW